MINEDYKRQLLTDALDARIKEITEYQVNIDNYRLAIQEISEDHDLQKFKSDLTHLLSASLFEQKKAKILYNVIKQQLES